MLEVSGWKKLEWKIKIGWSKNAALPIMAAALLVKWKVTLNNVPEIQDVFTYLDILNGIWVESSFKNNVLTLDSTNLKQTDFDLEKIKADEKSFRRLDKKYAIDKNSAFFLWKNIEIGYV